MNSNFFEKINTFKKIFYGPYFNCIVCNGCLYKRPAIDYKEKNITYLYTDVKSFDEKLYVGRTCDLKLGKVLKDKVPFAGKNQER